ncbi:ABC transporter permease [Actinoplanes cyaneus]|uniref:ABC transporter permease n=1 Tax=Actinoplanes cyaneus TaxID=52696 RepID=A0A919IQS3_9ACTN|nr:ATP-binding cassette domain-containing protein [Actinoplanes cyaneus]MCW2138221.1 ATP-binding cassette, subfamily B [Actinoplanes cyaneus]GID70484.1 ABC transporter permease [Actinoplanes cyaneus]
MRDVLTGCRKLLGTAWRMDRRRTTASVVLMILGAVATPLLAAALGVMTEAVVNDRVRVAVVSGVAVAALAVVSLTFGHFAHVLYFELSDLAEIDFDRQLIALSNGTPGIAHHEQAGPADSLTVLQHESKRYRQGLEALLNGMGLALAMAVTAVLLARLNPLLLLLPVAALAPLYAGRLAERHVDAARTTAAKPTRLAQNLFRLSTASRFAGELRVFRLQKRMRRQHAELWARASGDLARAQVRASAIRTAGQLVFAAVYVIGVLLVLRAASGGGHGAGALILTLTLAAQVNQQVTTAVSLLQHLQRMAAAYRRMETVRAAADDAPAGAAQRPARPAALPERLREGIVLDHVDFHYPGSGTPALSDFSLDLPAGSVVAVVGENGAGKTTLVKLLCGLYRPTGGRVLVDGVGLDRLPAPQWRTRVAAGFQDFVRFELSVQQAVGVGDLPRLDDEEAVRAALARAGGNGFEAEVRDGLATPLGRSHADGAELSGGQWQKLALGRALMRPAPLLLVLDEPTAALDAQAEHALFERFADEARRVARHTGGITLLISHRFSTVRMADRIVVVRDGRVAEVGSHADLVRAGGQYADLFALQADAYR